MPEFQAERISRVSSYGKLAGSVRGVNASRLDSEGHQSLKTFFHFDSYVVPARPFPILSSPRTIT